MIVPAKFLLLCNVVGRIMVPNDVHTLTPEVIDVSYYKARGMKVVSHDLKTGTVAGIIRGPV